MFRSGRFVPMGEASDSFRERGFAVADIAIDPDVFQDRADEAEREKKDTVDHLLAAMEQAIKTEKANEALERPRKDEADRQAAEDRKSVGQGYRESVSPELGGRRSISTTETQAETTQNRTYTIRS